MHKSDLKKLADPNFFSQPISIGKTDRELLLAELRTMVRIRLLEDEIGKLSQKGIVKTPIHLSIGQEAVAVP